MGRWATATAWVESGVVGRHTWIRGPRTRVRAPRAGELHSACALEIPSSWTAARCSRWCNANLATASSPRDRMASLRTASARAPTAGCQAVGAVQERGVDLPWPHDWEASKPPAVEFMAGIGSAHDDRRCRVLGCPGGRGGLRRQPRRPKRSASALGYRLRTSGDAHGRGVKAQRRRRRDGSWQLALSERPWPPRGEAPTDATLSR